MKQLTLLSVTFYCLFTGTICLQNPGIMNVDDHDVMTANEKGKDSLPDEHHTIEMLRDGESIAISYQSSGCFHFMSSRLTITREGDNIIARLFGDPKDPYRQGQSAEIPDLATKTATLDARQQQAFSSFEKKLSAIEDSGCTTVDTYSLKSKYLNMTRTDGGCAWNGYTSLLNVFFNNP